jgi:hypothetical protein
VPNEAGDHRHRRARPRGSRRSGRSRRTPGEQREQREQQALVCAGRCPRELRQPVGHRRGRTAQRVDGHDPVAQRRGGDAEQRGAGPGTQPNAPDVDAPGGAQHRRSRHLADEELRRLALDDP